MLLLPLSAAAQLPEATPTPPPRPEPARAEASGEPVATTEAETAAEKAAPASAPPEVAPVAEAAAESEGETSFTLAEAEGAAIEEVPKLELYGFADFNYTHMLGSRESEWRQYLAAYPSMYVGHLNLYLASKLSENWRSLAEVRFTYAPLGNDSRANPDGTFQTTDTAAADYAEIQRTINWSGIEIQRAWLEYQPLDYLTIRGGQWLTPYGYWNDDHGSPAIIGVHKPFAINDQLFPERQTGIEVYGKFFFDSTAVGYFLTLSNGRGPMDALRDLDSNKAIGGRLFLETTAFGNLTLGLNAYRGRYTASTKRYRIEARDGADPKVVLYRNIDVSYQELSLGLDAKLLWKDLHVQGELMLNEGAYDADHRPLTAGFEPRPTFVADYRRIGGYALVGYRLPWLTIMPYAMIEYLNFANTDQVGPVTSYTGGINLRPTPNVVLKAEFGLAKFAHLGSQGFGSDLTNFGAQAAWAF